MPRGSSSNSGNAPDPMSLRRDRSSDAATWRVLDPDGRAGQASPAWPLPTPASDTEVSLWGELWSLPQAVVWDENQVYIEVALYVRRLCEAENPQTATSATDLVRKLADSLGLSVVGMRSNRWRIDGGQQQTTKPQQAARRSSGGSSRDRFEVIAGGGS